MEHFQKNGSDNSDWNHIQETVTLLKLAVAQIQVTLKSGDESIDALADSFTTMMENMEDISVAVENLDNDMSADIIKSDCLMVSGKIQSAIIAFQFYDKLSQRLSHLMDSLNSLSDLVDSADKLNKPEHWQELRDWIEARYTVESDKKLYSAIISGLSIPEAIALSNQAPSAANDDDIELF